MTRCGSVLVCVAAIAAATSALPLAHAQTARTGGESPSAQLLMQLQQVSSERTSLQAENERLKKEEDDLRRKLDALKAAQGALDQRAKASSAELAQSAAQKQAVDEELKRTKDSVQELIARFRQTVGQLRDAEAAGADARAQLATKDRDFKTCAKDNLALYALNGEVLTKLEHQTVWTRVSQSEPFTKIKRVELENLVDDYRSRAQDDRLPPERANTGAPAGPPAGASTDSSAPKSPDAVHSMP